MAKQKREHYHFGARVINKAFKGHICATCAQLIDVGEKYRHVQLPWNGTKGPSEQHLHLRCPMKLKGVTIVFD